MSAIYIPNMDADTFEKICQEKGLQFVYVEVPKHGELIDRNALKKSTAVPLDGKPYRYVHIDNIEDAPTIIPADQKEVDE